MQAAEAGGLDSGNGYAGAGAGNAGAAEHGNTAYAPGGASAQKPTRRAADGGGDSGR